MTLDTSTNTSFSVKVPGLQLAVDSTSLGEFKTCPRKYYYSIIMGYQTRLESVDLTFGILLHSAVEHYHKAKAAGQGHQEALRSALTWTLVATWNKTLQRPWNSGEPEKNRLTLVRTLVWYLDAHGDNDSLQTVVLTNGKAAVELPFQFDSGFVTHSGERWVLCGHLDRIAKLNEVSYVVDLKTTKGSLGPSFFERFSPDNQFSMYALAGRIAFNEPISALIVDAAQVGVTFSRFDRALVQRDAGQADEWLKDTGYWLGMMEAYAIEGYWPQNDKACHQYRGCQFRQICARSPASRAPWLESQYKRRSWDPLARRTDV